MRIPFIGFIVAMGLLTAGAFADEVWLNNGSRVIGTIKDRQDDTWIIETPFAGDLKIKTSEVQGIATQRAVNVDLKGGARHTGILMVDAQRKTWLVDAQGGKAIIPVADIQWIWMPGADDPKQTAIDKAEAKARGIWNTKLSLGFTGQTGNNERINFFARFESTRTRNDNERLKFYAHARYSEDNGVRSTNEILGGIRLEHDIDDRNFWYVKGEAETDEFENIDLRATATAGLGHFLVKSDEQTIRVRGGLGFQHEKYDNTTLDTTDDAPIAEVGFDYTQKFQPWLLLEHVTNYYPSLERADNFRIASETTGSIPLDKTSATKLKLGVSFEYNAEPQAGVDRLDTYYFVLLAMDLD